MARLEQLKVLMDHFGQTPDDYDQSVEEDVRPYFKEVAEPSRWCAVTRGENGKFFFYPTFDELAAAAARALEYEGDGIFDERAIAIYDLDSGERYLPVVESVEWVQR